MILGASPVEVFGWQVSGQEGIDQSFAGQMRFSEGILAQFDSGFQSPFRTEMEIIGSLGTLFIPTPFRPGKNEEIFFARPPAYNLTIFMIILCLLIIKKI
jgi:hypothetical protein